MNNKFSWITYEKGILIIIFIICQSLLSFGYILEWLWQLEPCSLCIVQRLFFLLASLGALGALFSLRLAQLAGATVTFVSAAAGAGFALRHVWLQNLPADRIPVCGPGLAYMIEVMPWTEVLSAVIKGDGHCAETVWRFLGLTIPGWSLLWFIVIAGLSFYVIFRLLLPPVDNK